MNVAVESPLCVRLSTVARLAQRALFAATGNVLALRLLEGVGPRRYLNNECRAAQSSDAGAHDKKERRDGTMGLART